MRGGVAKLWVFPFLRVAAAKGEIRRKYNHRAIGFRTGGAPSNGREGGIVVEAVIGGKGV